MEVDLSLFSQNRCLHVEIDTSSFSKREVEVDLSSLSKG